MVLAWSMAYEKEGSACTIITEATKYGSSCANGKKRFSYKYDLIVTFIPTSRVIIDSLHLFLRRGDNLINLLMASLLRIDGTNKSTCMIERYEKFFK